MPAACARSRMFDLRLCGAMRKQCFSFFTSGIFRAPNSQYSPIDWIFYQSISLSLGSQIQSLQEAPKCLRFRLNQTAVPIPPFHNFCSSCSNCSKLYVHRNAPPRKINERHQQSQLSQMNVNMINLITTTSKMCTPIQMKPQ